MTREQLLKDIGLQARYLKISVIDFLVLCHDMMISVPLEDDWIYCLEQVIAEKIDNYGLNEREGNIMTDLLFECTCQDCGSVFGYIFKISICDECLAKRKSV